MPGYEFFLPATLCLLLFGLFLIQSRQIQHFREQSKLARKEKEAVIALMDNIGERMTRKIDLDETLEVIAQFVVDATQAESGAIFLLDESDQTLQAHVVVGLFPPLFESDAGESKYKYQAEKIRQKKIKLGEGIIGHVAMEEHPLLITDAEADPRIPLLSPNEFPVNSLILCPLRVRARNLGVLAVVNKHGDAIFDSRDMLLLQALADQVAITLDLVKLYDVLAKQQKLEQELTIARDFQNMLLPRECPKIDGYDFGASSEPALVVGGDFYDFIPIGEQHLGIVIGDVSGKGIPAALVMAMVRSIMRAEVRDTLSPKEALRRVNVGVLANTTQSVFVTIFYGILDLKTRRLRYTRAGHEPAIIHRARGENGLEIIKPEGMALGLMPPEIFDLVQDEVLQLDEGDMILLYTDGAIEAVNGSSEEYGRDRLMKMFSDQADQTPSELLKSLSADIARFAGGRPQHDDITMVAFRAVAQSEDMEQMEKEKANSEA